jgi:hypothetical protein
MELAQYARDVIPSLKQIDKGYPLFWFNPDKIYGFRMTNRAVNIMLDRPYKHWTFQLAEPISSGSIILMDRKITHPYHMNGNGKRITFFHEEIVSAMALSNNNLDVAVNLVYY